MHGQLTASAVAIILARTSWEAFANELIEQRDIDEKLKNANIKAKVRGVFSCLSYSHSNLENMKVWSTLFLINRIRNSLIHQKARSEQPGASPKDILTSLTSIGVIDERNVGEAWEKQILCNRVAGWCCVGVGEAIKALENIPQSQFRPPHQICTQVDEILKPLQ